MKLPTPETMLAFLKSKNWTVDKTDDYYYYMKSPSNIKFREGFRYRIPIHAEEEELDYAEYVTRLVFSWAELYDYDKIELLFTLTRDFDEAQAELRSIEKKRHRQKLLAQAS